MLWSPFTSETTSQSKKLTKKTSRQTNPTHKPTHNKTRKASHGWVSNQNTTSLSAANVNNTQTKSRFYNTTGNRWRYGKPLEQRRTQFRTRRTTSRQPQIQGNKRTLELRSKYQHSGLSRRAQHVEKNRRKSQIKRIRMRLCRASGTAHKQATFEQNTTQKMLW